jgi:glycosyltransferase involved in cell wall biosynthesis
LCRSIRGPASSVVLDFHHLVERAFRAIDIDAVIFTELSSLSLSPLVRRLKPGTAQIMDMHNVDHVLFEQELQATDSDDCQATEALAVEIERLRAVESSLWKNVDAFWATSDHDCRILSRMNAEKIPGYEIPNGVAVGMQAFDDRDDKASDRNVIFCGTLNYYPNRDALIWMHAEVWPLVRERIPEARLRVVGRGAREEDFASVRGDPSVEFVGEVPDVVPYYRDAGIAIVPLRHGSGTRLKILESMSLGNPVVSTPIGCQGVSAEHGKEILIAADAVGLAASIVELMSNPSVFDDLRRQARTLVEERYDWHVIGNRANESLAEIVK